MKNRKGFTLIELLAIIVILALIAVIISPIILGIIEDSKLSAATDSAYGYKEAIGKYYASQLSQNSDFMLNGEYTIGTDGSISDEENTYDIAVTGTIPNSGYVTIEKGTVTAGCIQINEFAVRIEDRKVTNTVKGNCETPEIVIEEFQQVTDDNPGIICGNGNAEDYDNSTVCYIYSVEDLVAFSNMVNSGKNFSGKTVHLMNNLDIQNDKSYANVNANQFGDVNENSTTSTTLKEELTDTEAKGFKPIGNSSNKFSGIFEGNTHTLKDIFINRSSIDYVGIFGYNNGTIKGLKAINTEVTGKKYSGLIAGENRGLITGIIADGDVTGTQYVGLISGENYGSNSKIEAIVSGNVIATESSKKSYIGGLTGLQYSSKTNGIYKSGSLTYNNDGCANRNVGCYNSDHPGTMTTAALNTIKLNTGTRQNTNINTNDGYDVSATDAKNIAMAEAVLDTYIGGDNNDDGYYYDYDSHGELTIYKLSERPLEITMSGEGTESEPYIINNYNELKQVAYNLGTNGAGIYYKLNADIDLTGKNPIMLGSGTASDSPNRFNSVFDGDAHTISNLTLIGHNYTGLFGYNNGTIRGLKVENINVTGYQYSGLIAGENRGLITGIMANGNVSGLSYAGLIAGENYGSGSKIEAIVSGNVVTTESSTKSYIGGLTGLQYNATTKGIYKSGSLTYNNTDCAWRTVGCKNADHPGTMKTVALSSITKNGNISSNTDISINDGYSTSIAGTKNIALAEAVLDTYIGGDNDGDGYYYDYNNSGELTVYSISRNPLTITMTGQGTAESPYIINNYNDLKQVAYNLGTNGAGIYYKLNADIDLTGKNPIMLGSGTASDSPNRFTSVFDGDAHTIRNITLIGHNYTGLFGYNNGTIRGLKVENINVTGYQYSGLIAGSNRGNITGIMANGNVSGLNYAGLIAGENNGSSSKIEAIVSGNVVTTESSTKSYIGGLTGLQYNATTKGIYKSGSLTYNNAECAWRTVGCYNSDHPGTMKTVALSSITKNGNISSNADISINDGYSTSIAGTKNIAMAEAVLDTYIGGDNDGDGYYYDYNNSGELTVYSISRNPLTITMTGQGTAESPYIINNYNDLKQAAYNPSGNYRLNANINITNQNPIMLGSSSTGNNFTGTFDGNTYMISNLTLIGHNYTGLFGYNTGTIKGLKVDSINATGYQYVGLIAGSNRGTITSVIANGNVSGLSYAGLIAGENNGSGCRIEAITSGNVTTTESSTKSYIGGLTGLQYNATTKGIYKSGSLTYNNADCAHRTVGCYNSDHPGTMTTIALDIITMNGNTSSNTNINTNDGKTYTAAQLQTLTAYQEVGLNTSSETGEYRYALDSNYNPYLIKNTSN